jgi:hypothetical protein
VDRLFVAAVGVSRSRPLVERAQVLLSLAKGRLGQARRSVLSQRASTPSYRDQLPFPLTGPRFFLTLVAAGRRRQNSHRCCIDVGPSRAWRCAGHPPLGEAVSPGWRYGVTAASRRRHRRGSSRKDGAVAARTAASDLGTSLGGQSLTTILTTIVPSSGSSAAVRWSPVCRLSWGNVLKRTTRNPLRTSGGQGGAGSNPVSPTAKAQVRAISEKSGTAPDGFLGRFDRHESTLTRPRRRPSGPGLRRSCRA